MLVKTKMPVCCDANKLNLSCGVCSDTLTLFCFASVVDWLYNVMERAACGKLASSLKIIELQNVPYQLHHVSCRYST